MNRVSEALDAVQAIPELLFEGTAELARLTTEVSSLVTVVSEMPQTPAWFLWLTSAVVPLLGVLLGDTLASRRQRRKARREAHWQLLRTLEDFRDFLPEYLFRLLLAEPTDPEDPLNALQIDDSDQRKRDLVDVWVDLSSKARVLQHVARKPHLPKVVRSSVRGLLSGMEATDRGGGFRSPGPEQANLLHQKATQLLDELDKLRP